MGEQGTGARRARRAARLVSAAMLCACGACGATEARAAVTFADAVARECFESYVAFLASDPQRLASEAATVRQLERSDVEYRLSVGGAFEWNVEGALTTDGERVLVAVAGAAGGLVSLNSRIAHELEHARQFDDGEIAFERDAATGRWSAHRASYDIGDEVKAWAAQLRASVESDFWKRPQGSPRQRQSLLGEFAVAGTDEARARVLAVGGYRNRRPVFGSDVTFGARSGYAVRQVVRPASGRQFFGRVRAVF